MSELAKLLPAIASLITAIAWPLVTLIVVGFFRRQIVAALEKLPSLIDRMQKMKVGIFELGAELDKAAIASGTSADLTGKISAQDIQSAAAIKIEAKSLDIQALRDQIQRLCVEYETTRNILAPGRDRTRAMSLTLSKMRAIGLAAAPLIDELKPSTSAGNRLAAIAIMQMMPEKTDIDWLKERFSTETPFVFFQAAIALEKAVHRGIEPAARQAKLAAKIALKEVLSFQGIPDKNTVELLRELSSTDE